MRDEEITSATSPPSQAWRSYISGDLPRSVQESADSAIRSANSLRQSSSTHIRSLKDFVPQIGTRYRNFEEAFFQEVKGARAAIPSHPIQHELVNLREHPALAGGVAVSALLLMRGPRRFLFRHTLGWFQSEEAQFVRSERHVKELSLSVDLMKKESKKLLERALLAEKDMKCGQSNLMDAGSHIQSLTRSVYKAEAEAAGLMELLREIPGREALKLRAEVASMASHLRQQRSALNKRILKISEFGIPV